MGPSPTHAYRAPSSRPSQAALDPTQIAAPGSQGGSVEQAAGAQMLRNLQPDTVVAGRYRVERELARGGMGVVFVAYDEKFDNQVALKITSQFGQNVEESKRRFRLEAQIGNLLGKFQGFVRALDWGVLESGSFLYLTMDLVHDATPLVLTEGPREARLHQVLTAARLVAKAHEVGVIHRDLKPGNFLRTPDGKIALTDFGLAKLRGREAQEAAAHGADLTQTGVALGTPRFMAPEQFEDAKSVDERADVYSLGAMLFLALTGEDAYKGNPRKVLVQQIQARMGALPVPRPRDRDSNVSPALDELCARTMAPDPTVRPADAGEFAAALEAAIRGAPVPAALPPATGVFKLTGEHSFAQYLEDESDLEVPGESLPAAPPAEEAGELTADSLSLLDNPDFQISVEGMARPAAKQGQGPIEAGAAAIYAYELHGDLSYLNEAARHYERALKSLSTPAEKAAALAGLAQVLLMRGARDKAMERAAKALRLDPTCLFAVDVLVRTSRNESARGSLKTGFAAAAKAAFEGNWKDVRALVGKLVAAFKGEPSPRILRILVESQARNDRGIAQALTQSMERYPSQRFGDLTFGGSLDGDLVECLLDRALKVVEPARKDVLNRTLNAKTDGNPVGQALVLGAGIAHVALGMGSLIDAERKRLHTLAAAALFLLRHHEAACKHAKKAEGVKDQSNKQRMADNYLQRAQAVAERADMFGVPLARGAYDCVGIKGATDTLRRGVKEAVKDLKLRHKELQQGLTGSIKVIVRDGDLRKQVSKVSAGIGRDLMLELDRVARSLGQMKADRRGALMNALMSQSDDEAFTAQAWNAVHSASDGLSRVAREAKFKMQMIGLRKEWRAGIQVLSKGLLEPRYLNYPWEAKELQDYASVVKAAKTFISYHEEEYRKLEYRITKLHGLR